MTNKRLRVSLLMRLAIIFAGAIALTLLLIIITGTRRSNLVERSAAQSMKVAKAAATSAAFYVGSYTSVAELSTDAPYREEIRQSFRRLCKSIGLKYLYLYTVDGEGRHYLISAAEDDEDDEKANREFGFGSFQKAELYQSELNVLNGDVDGEYEFVDNKFGNVCMFIAPVTDNNGKLIALIGADYGVEDLASVGYDNLRFYLASFVTVLGIILIAMIIMLRQTILAPIANISKKMRSFVTDPGTRLDERKTIFEDEITDIEDSFHRMASDISQYIANIEDLTRKEVQVKTQLEVASNIQMGIVPEEYGLFAEGCDIFGLARPARQVGGDFYDIFRLDDRRVCVVIGDISGKGVSAALFMTRIKTSIREILKAGYGLKKTLNMVNDEVASSNPENMFATVFAAVLDTATGELKYANAGHNKPVWVGEAAGDEPGYMNIASGIAIGVYENIGIEETVIKLRDNEGLYLYTDGITEAVEKDRKQFGQERLLEVIKESSKSGKEGMSAAEMVFASLNSVMDFTQGEEQFDDITCVAIIYHDRQKETKKGPKRADFGLIKRGILSSMGINDHSKQTVLACEEIYANIAEYSGAKNCLVTMSKEGRNMYMTFLDDGIIFDPTAKVRIEKEFEELDEGGMGIAIAKQFSKRMEYDRTEDKNRLTLTFRYEQ